mgnify:CR=1 FL=1
MLKYLCEQARKNKIREAISTSFKKAELPNEMVESTRWAGEAFIKLFEFTAQDFWKKAKYGVYSKMNQTRILRERKFNSIKNLTSDHEDIRP